MSYVVLVGRMRNGDYEVKFFNEKVEAERDNIEMYKGYGRQEIGRAASEKECMDVWQTYARDVLKWKRFN